MTTRPRAKSARIQATVAEVSGKPSLEDSGPPGSRSFALPSRRYLRIGEVAELLGLKPHVLRYWETEFKQLRPSKSRQGQRLYRRADVEMLFLIKELLHDERYTIAGARERLDEIIKGKASRPARPRAGTMRLEQLRDGLEELLLVLDRRERDIQGRSR